MVPVDGLVALDRHEILRGGQLTVEVVGRDDHRFVLGEAAGRVLHDGEGLGENLVEDLLDPLVDALGRLVDLLRELFLFGEGRFGQFEAGFELDDAGFVRGDRLGDALLEGLAAGAQLVVRKLADGGVDRLDLDEVGLDLLAILVGFRAENEFDQTGENTHGMCAFIFRSFAAPVGTRRPHPGAGRHRCCQRRKRCSRTAERPDAMPLSLDRKAHPRAAASKAQPKIGIFRETNKTDAKTGKKRRSSGRFLPVSERCVRINRRRCRRIPSRSRSSRC